MEQEIQNLIDAGHAVLLVSPKYIDDYIKLYNYQQVDTSTIVEIFKTINARIVMSVLYKIIRTKNLNHPLYQIFMEDSDLLKNIFNYYMCDNGQYLRKNPNHILYARTYCPKWYQEWLSTYHIKNNIMIYERHNVFNLYGLIYVRKNINIPITSQMKMFLLQTYPKDFMIWFNYDIFKNLPKEIRYYISDNMKKICVVYQIMKKFMR